MLVIPTYNERENVPGLVERIRKNLGGIPIFFVDDSSPDGTAEAIRRLQENDDNIHLLMRAGKLGLGSAYREAFRKIMRERLADYVITLDADLSHPPEVLPHLTEKIKKFPVVVGSRYISGGDVQNWNRWRQLISQSGNIYARLLTGVPVSDLTSGLVAYQVEALRKVNLDRMTSDGYAFQIEMKCLLHHSNIQIHEHPITFVERREGKSKFSTPIILEGFSYPARVFVKRIFKL
ncbi:MAG: polyprenol monophosphomannose synthase [Patescibacteria group bacterium]